MAVFKCKMCGGDIQVDAGAAIGTCGSCGTTSTLPKANEERLVNMFNRANHFRRLNEFDKALGTYESILSEDNTNAEAHWCAVLCRYGIEYVEDPGTRERIPTCHRVQYTPILSDADYLAALEHTPDEYSREIYETEARKINEIQKGILAISNREEPFDVFICYKETASSGSRTRDSVRAQEIFHELSEDYRVFFSKITLEDKLGQQYEPYIFSALNSAKVMLVIGTCREHFDAVWVKNEWSRFLTLMKGDRSRILIPCYQDMDAYDLPDELANLQAQDMGKLGFMQDLVRGVKKILAPAIQTAATITDSNTTSGRGLTPGASQLLDRAGIFLEDGDFDSANEYYNRALDLEPRNAQAYLGKCLAALKMRSERELLKHDQHLDKNGDFQRALRFADSDLKKRLEEYNSSVIEKLNNVQFLEITYQQALSTAKKYDSESLLNASTIMDGISNYKDAEKLSIQWRKIVEDRASQQELLNSLIVLGGFSWKILTFDGNKALLITAEIIDEKPYDENDEAEEVTWATCSLRKYLNGDFLKKFSSDELARIIEVVNINDNNDQYGINGGKDTTDRVFLLSINDSKKYFSNKEDCIAKMDGEINAWWLRSPGEFETNSALIDETGAIDYRGQCVDFECGIRPAMWRIMY